MSQALPILDDGPQRPVYAQGPRSLDAVRLLRISVTDRCNLRCVYCMPLGGVAFEDQRDLLAVDDLLAVAEAARSVGVDHFKLTGGEPTVRADLAGIVAGLKALDPADLSLTTNGLLLDRLAADLRDAGLDRITLSCDSLRPDRFERITRGRAAPIAYAKDAGHEADSKSTLFDRFQRGLNAAADAGFRKIKLNVVVIGGVNDDEVVDFARLTMTQPWTVRFIEYMPLGESQLTDHPDAYLVDNATIMERIERELGPFEPVQPGRETGVGPAKVFRLPGAAGRVGFISAMSKPFCESCNRLRLTATGQLRSCLFDGGEVDVLPALRPRADRDALVGLMRRCVAMKPQVHSHRGNRQMSQIGG